MHARSRNWQLLDNRMDHLLNDRRLLKRIAAEAVRLGKGIWIGMMSLCWGQVEWKDVNVLKDQLSTVKVRVLLEAIAWRKIWEDGTMQEMETKLKLEMLKRIVKCRRVHGQSV